jgi:hypothetical protein
VVAALAGLVLWADVERRTAQRNFEIAEKPPAASSPTSPPSRTTSKACAQRRSGEFSTPPRRSLKASSIGAKGNDRLKYQQSAMYDRFALVYAAQGAVCSRPAPSHSIQHRNAESRRASSFASDPIGRHPKILY